MWKSAKLQCLLPLSVYLGLFQSFQMGTFPTLIDDDSLKFLVMASYGLSAAVCSKILGKISPSLSPYHIISFGLSANIAVFVWLLAVPQSVTLSVWSLFMMALVGGMVEAALFMTLFTLYPVICGQSPETLSNAQFFNQFGLAMGYALYSILGFDDKIVFNLSVLAAAGLVCYRSDIIRQSIEGKESEPLFHREMEMNVNVNDGDMNEVVVMVDEKTKIGVMFGFGEESDGYESTYSEI